MCIMKIIVNFFREWEKWSKTAFVIIKVKQNKKKPVIWQTNLLGILYRITVVLAAICWHLLEQLKFSVKAEWLKIIIAHINFRGFNKFLYFQICNNCEKRKKKNKQKNYKKPWHYFTFFTILYFTVLGDLYIHVNTSSLYSLHYAN